MLNAGGLLSTAQSSGGFSTTIAGLFEQIGMFLSSSGGLQTAALIAVAVFLAGVVVCIFLISRTYESRLLKCVTGFNRYFKANPFKETAFIQISSL